MTVAGDAGCLQCCEPELPLPVADDATESGSEAVSFATTTTEPIASTDCAAATASIAGTAVKE